MIEYELKDIVEITSSKRIYYSDYVDSGIPFYRSREVINLDRGEDLKELIFITPERYLEIKTKFGAPTKNDILLTSVGTIGNAYLVREDDEFYFKDGNLTWFRNWNDLAIPKFVFYWLKSPFGQGKLYQQLIGSSQKALTIVALKKIKIDLPSKAHQLIIASILSTYDELIKNNLKRIKLLEEMAFLMFKGIVKSEKLVEHPILDICHITDGTHDSPKQQVDGFYLVTGKHLIGGFIDFSSAYFISEADHDKIQKRSKVVNGDLVLSNIGTIGNVAIIDSPFEFSVKNVIIFKPNSDVFTSFLYCYLNSGEMQTRFQQESSGTSQRFISLAYTRALKVKLPSEDVLIEFHHDVSRLLKLKSILNLQNTKLREARDILLPKLMSGEIEV